MIQQFTAFAVIFVLFSIPLAVLFSYTIKTDTESMKMAKLLSQKILIAHAAGKCTITKRLKKYSSVQWDIEFQLENSIVKMTMWDFYEPDVEEIIVNGVKMDKFYYLERRLISRRLRSLLKVKNPEDTKQRKAIENLG